ncbi:MAG: T9SS type A sorting domain-containing protein [Flavobacteriaceae bacterium]
MKRAIYILVFIFCQYNVFSQIVNNGILQIESSTTVYFGDEYTNSVSGIHNSDGDLYLNDNFINNGTTTSVSGTTFFTSSINDLLTISGTTNNINLYNLEININGASKLGVSIADNFGLFVENTVNFQSGDLRLVGDAQLIQTHTGVDTNSSNIGRLLKDQNGISSAYAYNYWSSPVNTGGNYTLSGNLFDGTDSSINTYTPQLASYNSGAPYNGLPSVVDGGGNVTTPLTLNNQWFYKYIQGASGQYADWVKIYQNTSLSPGTGFTMKGSNSADASQNYVFKGAPNNGEYLFTISNGESSLLGNPYPSAIDTHKFINDNLSLINGTIYFWIDGGSSSHYTSDYLGGYAIRNLSGGVVPSVSSSMIAGIGDAGTITAPTQYMAVSQGFFVDAIGNGNIVFNNSQRIFKTESSGESVSYRSTSNNESEHLADINDSSIRIGYEDPESFHRQLLLSFLPDSPATLSYDIGYDAFMYDPREDEVFYIIDNISTNQYVIQGVGAFNDLYEFPLGVKITQEGTHTIMLDAVDNFTGSIYIKDLVLNTTHNLTESSFNLNLTPGEYLDRFKVVFQESGVLAVNEFERDELNVYYNKANSVIVKNPREINLTNISIYNMLGQQIAQVHKNRLNEAIITIPFSHEKGVYFVVVKSNEKEKAYKIIN